MRKGFDDGGEGEVVLLQSRDLGGDRRHPSGELIYILFIIIKLEKSLKALFHHRKPPS